MILRLEDLYIWTRKVENLCTLRPQGWTCLIVFRRVLTNIFSSCLNPPTSHCFSSQLCKHDNTDMDREHEKCICCHVQPIQWWVCSQTWPLKIKQPTSTMTWTQMQTIWNNVFVSWCKCDTCCLAEPTKEFMPEGMLSSCPLISPY